MGKWKQSIVSRTFQKKINNSKYEPHQGEQEKARRRMRLERKKKDKEWL